MSPDLRQAILECLVDYFNDQYDGSPTPSWVDVMAEEYADSCNAPKGPYLWAWIEKEIAEYNRAMKKYKEERDEEETD